MAPPDSPPSPADRPWRPPADVAGRRDEFIVWTRADQWFIGTTTCGLLLALALACGGPGRPPRILEKAGSVPLPPPRYQVNVRTASWPALAQIPGIGETLARRIVAARRDQALSPERLSDVNGIGAKKLQLALPYLR